MKRNIKTIAAFMAGAMIFSAVPMSVSADNNAPDDVFYEEDIIEEEPESAKMFFCENGKYYYMSPRSNIITGLTNIPDKDGQPRWYWFRKDRSLATGFLKTSDGKIMYAEPDPDSPKFGQIYRFAEVTVNGKTYAFGDDGDMITGWYSGRYYKRSGAMLKGRKVRIDGTAYIFDENGNSVPAKLAYAKPSELSFPAIKADADTELLASGIGNVTADNELLGMFRGRYRGTVLYNGEEYEMSVIFDKDKKIWSVTLTIDGDVTEDFNDIFADEYEKRYDPKYAGDRTYFEKACDGYYEYADTVYEDGKTEIEYGWDYYDE